MGNHPNPRGPSWRMPSLYVALDKAFLYLTAKKKRGDFDRQAVLPPFFFFFLSSPDDHLAIGHATCKNDTVGVPGIDSRDSGQDMAVTERGHQVACASGINIDRLAHVPD